MNINIGDRVLARYYDKGWYHGFVMAVEVDFDGGGNSLMYAIHFEDGDIDKVKHRDIVKIDDHSHNYDYHNDNDEDDRYLDHENGGAENSSGEDGEMSSPPLAESGTDSSIGGPAKDGIIDLFDELPMTEYSLDYYGGLLESSVCATTGVREVVCVPPSSTRWAGGEPLREGASKRKTPKLEIAAETAAKKFHLAVPGCSCASCLRVVGGLKLG